MLRAVDREGNLVHAMDAVRGVKYRCLACGSDMILRKGDVVIHHFAHKAKQCTDSWHYDMSDWHLYMQSLFPKENQEVVVRVDGVVHRADVLMDGVVVEFQHSPISIEDVMGRCEFFWNLGNKVCWVMHVPDFSVFEGDDFVTWRHPKHWFDKVNFSRPDFSVWLVNDDNVARRIKYPVDSGASRFSRFVFYSGVCLNLVPGVVAGDFFKTGSVLV